MKKIVLLTVLLAFAVFAMPVHAKEQTKRVVVVNGPDNPVPIQGDVTVTDTVDVNVTNTSSNPVPVVISNEFFPRIPYQEYERLYFDGIKPSVVQRYRLPEGYRLVIETFSVRAQIPDDLFLIGCSIVTWVSGVSAHHHFALSKVGESGGSQQLCGLQQVRLYADPGSLIEIQIGKNGCTGTGPVDISISGYLLPEDSPNLAP